MKTAELEGQAAIGTFYDENIPQRVNVISAKWAFAWKTDSNEFITKAKTMLIARGFRQQPCVDYFEGFAPTPAISYIEDILVIVVKQRWEPQDWDVKHAFVNAALDVEVYMKLRHGCGETSGKDMKPERSLYEVK